MFYVSFAFGLYVTSSFFLLRQNVGYNTRFLWLIGNALLITLFGPYLVIELFGRSQKITCVSVRAFVDLITLVEMSFLSVSYFPV